MNTPLSVAISPCPNDTFIFAAWILGLVPERLSRPVRFFWADVEELNQSAAAGRHDVIKLSAAAALALSDDYEILPSGAAFGHGAGPKLVTRPDAPATLRTIAVPGLHTTAYTVLRAALPQGFTPVPMLFSDIVDAVREGRVDAGLVIHETALVYARHGLELRMDLGAWWNAQGVSAPIPLGVIAARRDLPPEDRDAVVATIRASLAHARAARADIWPLVRTLAQELDDETLERHIAAYVNDLSDDMGEAGRAALDLLSRLASGASIG
ncbi:1,4-dihydroxy-6-naphthoate synthase [Desulfobaculum xiamenense]|uniref:1,4-dihydroxy-6-naphtoate synthase n=1 Tax=Desulfobaculum xiamenense TaxID=995050 RepID=A0A846QSR3_9BACT|nr:1,4-dihydroxy-6-naphthoate synthase [Desulfobaculum xiamenense]NJB68214.1 1,4-dihydroxy-6-naphthoate synthase [Desulfobaculum xiamenense]